MKVIVADKISDRGVQLLKEQPGWNVVMTTKDSLNGEIADADALIVRSATKVTAELLDQAKGSGGGSAGGGGLVAGLKSLFNLSELSRLYRRARARVSGDRPGSGTLRSARSATNSP